MEQQFPLFSVIIPAYQVGQEIGECLASVQNQTEQSFETICVYDESTDHTESVIRQFCHKDKRFRLIRGKQRGLSGARNIGLDCAKGRYIIFVDGDDCLNTNALQSLLSLFQTLKPEIIVYGANCFPAAQKASPYLLRVLSPINFQYQKAKPSIIFNEPCAKPFVWRNAFLAAFLQRNRLRFDEEIRVAEDVAFQFSAFSRAQNIVFSKEKLYNYRIARKDSLMDCYNRNHFIRLRGHVEVVKKVVADWRAQGLLQKYGTPMAIWILEFLFSEGISTLSDIQRKDIYSQTLCQVEAVLEERRLQLPLPYFGRWIQTMMKENIFLNTPSFAFRISRKCYYLGRRLQRGGRRF